MIYIGVDPGKNGGIAFIDGNKPVAYPLCREVINEVLLDLVAGFGRENVFGVVEKVGARPGQGVVSMFSFGKEYGYIQGVFETLKIPYELVTPQKWKKEFSVTADKQTSIDVCKRLFPTVNLKATERCRKDHDGMAEALLMAEYARRTYGA